MMSDKMVLVPEDLLSCQTADGLDVQDVLDDMTGADWHSGSYVPQTANEYRNQIIQELIEKAEAECHQDPETGIRGERKPGEDPVTYGVRLRQAENAAEWLKSQMEGGE